jgi:hypothetical protein
MGSEKVFIIGSRSFVYIMKSKGLRIDPWGTPCFTIPHFEETFSFFFFVFYLSDRIWTSSLLFLECHNNVTLLIKFPDLHSQKLSLNHRILSLVFSLVEQLTTKKLITPAFYNQFFCPSSNPVTILSVGVDYYCCRYHVPICAPLV